MKSIRKLIKKTRKIFISFLAVIILVSFFLLIAFMYINYIYPEVKGQGSGRIVYIDIPSGIGPLKLSHVLEKNGLIQNRMLFYIYIKIYRIMPSVQKGKHLFSDDWSINRIVGSLTNYGGIEQVRITIPEGFTINDIAEVLSERGITGYSSFIEASENSQLLSQLNMPVKSYEGFLFPDTYYLPYGKGPSQYVSIMYNNFIKQTASLFNKQGCLNPEYMEFINNKLNVITFASIIEAEGMKRNELPIIAGVFYNRLFLNKFPSHLLQSDPTVVYGCIKLKQKIPSCVNFNGSLTRQQLNDPQNSYNTYIHSGLPPSPINNPGIYAIKAVLNPANVAYFYFVAKGDGTHYFSKSLQEHNKAVKTYILKE